MKLVDDWREGHKWGSTRFFVAIAALPEIWVLMPQEWRAAFPPSALMWLAAAFAVCGFVARFLDLGGSAKP